MKASLAVLCVGLLSLPAHAGKAAKKSSSPETFYVYANKGDMKNHFAPSGWMGDYGDLKLNDAHRDDCIDGQTCVKWTYSAKGAQGANWAGVFWQQPPNNWGDRPGGYDLSGFKKLTFWAKGEKGNEKIAEFKTGGITGEHGDSDAANIGPVILTKEWKRYTIELADKNLSHWIGGFCWAASRDDNPDGFTIFFDEIRFEK